MNNLEENQPFFEGSIVIRFWELATALFLYPSFIIVNLLRWCVPKSLKKLNTTGLLVIFDLLVIIIIFFTPLSKAASLWPGCSVRLISKVLVSNMYHNFYFYWHYHSISVFYIFFMNCVSTCSWKKLNTTGLLVIFDLLVIIFIFFGYMVPSMVKRVTSIFALCLMSLLALPFCVLHLSYALCFYMFGGLTFFNKTERLSLPYVR